jgi:hypothetical protein
VCMFVLYILSLFYGDIILSDCVVIYTPLIISCLALVSSYRCS